MANSDNLICGFAYFNPLRAQLNLLHTIDQDNSAARLNDGCADRQGRLWAGTMVEGGEPFMAALYCLDNRLRVSNKLSGIGISNGLSWSADSKLSTIQNRRLGVSTVMILSLLMALCQIEQGSYRLRMAAPRWRNGGCAGLYLECPVPSAQWAGSRIVCYTPASAVDFVLPLQVSQPRYVTFGGLQFNMQLITSAL